ncbi:TSUP family transporter [Candidatus Woesearchaeota archaeon]|nr:TSUP family transporter [Candidatus Woesearchaeota archaeon]
MDIIIILIAVFIGFFVQGILGFGGGLVAMPLLVISLSVVDSVAVLSGLMAVHSVWFTYTLRRKTEWKIALPLGLGGILGIIVGVALLLLSPPLLLRKLLGAYLLLYIGYYFWSAHKFRIAKGSSIIFGFIGGIFSGLFANGGPFYATYIHHAIKKADIIRATIFGALVWGNVLRFLMLIIAGSYTQPLIWSVVLALPVFIVAGLLARSIAKRINQKAFEGMVLVVLIISGLLLVLS